MSSYANKMVLIPKLIFIFTIFFTILHPNLYKENNISFKCRSTSTVTMCITGVEIHSYFGLKDKLQYMPEYKEPVSFMMMSRSSEE